MILFHSSYLSLTLSLSLSFTLFPSLSLSLCFIHSPYLSRLLSLSHFFSASDISFLFPPFLPACIIYFSTALHCIATFCDVELKAVQTIEVPLGSGSPTVTISLQANKWNRTDTSKFIRTIKMFRRKADFQSILFSLISLLITLPDEHFFFADLPRHSLFLPYNYIIFTRVFVFFFKLFPVTIFVADNYGNDYSEFHSIKIFGSPVMGTDVAAIKGENITFDLFMYSFIYSSIHSFIYLFIYLSLPLFISFSIYLFIYLSIVFFVYLFIHYYKCYQLSNMA